MANLVRSFVSLDPGPAGGLRIAAQRALEHVFVWVALARSRRALAQLDERGLRDIGLDRATAADEAAKPFWRSV